MNQKKLTIILVPILILTILWVVFNIYHNHVSSTITDVQNYQIIPIEGSFNKNAIEQIKKRTKIEAANEISAEISEVPTPSPTPESLEDESGSSSAVIEPTPSDQE